MVNDLSQLSHQINQISAELKLLNGKRQINQSADHNPWLSLQEAASLLRFKSARALKERIKRGQFPPECWRQIPSPSGKRHSYLVHVGRYVKQLN